MIANEGFQALVYLGNFLARSVTEGSPFGKALFLMRSFETKTSLPPYVFRWNACN